MGVCALTCDLLWEDGVAERLYQNPPHVLLRGTKPIYRFLGAVIGTFVCRFGRFSLKRAREQKIQENDLVFHTDVTFNGRKQISTRQRILKLRTPRKKTLDASPLGRESVLSRRCPPTPFSASKSNLNMPKALL